MAEFGDFIKNSGLAITIVVFGLYFISFKAWPWVTNVYFPALEARAKRAEDREERREKEQRESDANIERALTSLADGTHQLPALIEKGFSAAFNASTLQTANVIKSGHDTIGEKVDSISLDILSLREAISKVLREEAAAGNQAFQTYSLDVKGALNNLAIQVSNMDRDVQSLRVLLPSTPIMPAQIAVPMSPSKDGGV